jgi:hypothetical protein
MHRMIGHTTLFFSQRKPETLGKFNWVIDGKNPQKVTNWENWLGFYARGALASLSARDPAPRPDPKEGSLLDFTYFDKAHTGKIGDIEGVDPALLLKHFRFSSDIDMGLELVDILSNAIRRTLRGGLDRAGWINFHKLMIDRNETYIKFPIFQGGPEVLQNAAYGAIVNEGFRNAAVQCLPVEIGFFSTEHAFVNWRTTRAKDRYPEGRDRRFASWRNRPAR